MLEIKSPPPPCFVLGSGKGPSGPRGLIISFNVMWWGRDCGHAASENAFDLAQVLGAQWAGNNGTFVRSRRGAGLRKHSQGNSRTLFVVVQANITTNCQEKFTKQNTGDQRGLWGFSRSGFQLGLKDLLSSCLLPADVSNSGGWLGPNSQSYFVFDPPSRSPRVNEWRNVQITSVGTETFPSSRSLLLPGIWRKSLRLNISLPNQAFDILEDTSVGCTFLFLVDDLINKGGKILCFFLTPWKQSCLFRVNYYQVTKTQDHTQQGWARGWKVNRVRWSWSLPLLQHPFAWAVKSRCNLAPGLQLAWQMEREPWEEGGKYWRGKVWAEQYLVRAGNYSCTLNCSNWSFLRVLENYLRLSIH